MRTVGELLKAEREKKFYLLEEIEKITKIQKRQLEALEEGDYAKLPPPTFIQGFIKNYGKFLGLDTEKLLAIFRREFSEFKHPPRILDSFKDPLETSKFKITPGRALGTVVISLVLIFIAYLWFEYRFLVGGPFLEVTKPVDQVSLSSAIVEVAGRVDPESHLSINNQEVGTDPAGKFSQEITLSNEINTIVIIATSKSGKTTKLERTVFRRQ